MNPCNHKDRVIVHHNNTFASVSNTCAKVDKTKTSGIVHTRNFGFELSKGKFINWLDSDDLLSENKIEEQVKSIEATQSDIATCMWGNFEDDITNLYKFIDQPYYSNFNLGIQLLNSFGEKGGFFPQHVYLVKRSIVDNTGLWDENLKINQDGEFFCRILLNCKKIP